MTIERNSKIDILKGIGIYFVVIGHMYSRESDVCKVIYMLNNYIFFIISGYLFYYSYDRRKYTEQWCRKIVMEKIFQLVVPYFFWSTVSVICHITMDYFQGKSSIIYWIKFIYIDAGSVWFFISLFWIYLIFVSLILLYRLQIHKVVSYCLIAVLLSFIYLCPINMFAIINTRWMFPFFALGFMVARKKEILNQYKVLISLISWIGMVFIFICREYADRYVLFDITDINKVREWIICIIIITLAVFWLYRYVVSIFFRTTYLKKIFALFGMKTLIIYPMSIFFSQYLTRIVESIGLVTNMNVNSNVYVMFCYNILIALYGCISIFVCIRIDYLMSRNKVYQLLTKGTNKTLISISDEL